MRLLQLYRQLRIWLHYRRAAFVNTREELMEAMRIGPPRIVVDGDEALRAFAAALLNGEDEAAAGPQGDSTAPLLVTPVGRIRDGYRKRREPKPGVRIRLKGGLDLVLVAATGICAALITEWLSYPATPRMIERPHGPGHSKPVQHVATFATELPNLFLRLAILLFGAIAVIAFGWVLWQASGLGLPRHIGWRLEYRIQGRLVMSRVRRRTA
jgi:hypothetical protein